MAETLTLVEKCRKSLRISRDAFDDEILGLIEAAKADLGIAGVTSREETDPLIVRAIITYVKMNFGDELPADYDKLKASYDEQKSQLGMDSSHTNYDTNTEASG